jgi:NADH:ubiquinone oxidoreductase subunit 6 (subunit J)
MNMIIMKRNEKRNHKFIFNGALFGKPCFERPTGCHSTNCTPGFCSVRIVTMTLRIAWVFYPRNISLGIAAQIFVYVGSIILYIVNWFFAQRIVRAQHPRFGWSKPYRIIFRAAIGCLILCLFMLIVAAVQQFFTENNTILRIDRDLQLAGQTYFAAFCFAPILAVTLSLIFPRQGTERFGAGRLRNNISILLVAACVIFFGQIFRCVTTWLPPKPLRNAQGYVVRPSSTLCLAFCRTLQTPAVSRVLIVSIDNQRDHHGTIRKLVSMLSTSLLKFL